MRYGLESIPRNTGRQRRPRPRRGVRSLCPLSSMDDPADDPSGIPLSFFRFVRSFVRSPIEHSLIMLRQRYARASCLLACLLARSLGEKHRNVGGDPRRGMRRQVMATSLGVCSSSSSSSRIAIASNLVLRHSTLRILTCRLLMLVPLSSHCCCCCCRCRSRDSSPPDSRTRRRRAAAVVGCKQIRWEEK